MARFYEPKPVIVHTKNGLRGVVGTGPGVALSRETESALTDRFYSPGLLLLTPGSAAPVDVSFPTKPSARTTQEIA